MNLLTLDGEFLLVDKALWNRITQYDAVSGNSLSDVTVTKLTQEVEDFLVENELFQPSERIATLIGDVNRKIAKKLDSVLSGLSANLKSTVNTAEIGELLAEYKKLAKKFTSVTKEAFRLKRDAELTKEANKIRKEMDDIFDQISAIIKKSFGELNIDVSDEAILEMVSGSRDDLVREYMKNLGQLP